MSKVKRNMQESREWFPHESCPVIQEITLKLQPEYLGQYQSPTEVYCITIPIST
jgi:hypothetical protein